MCGWDADVGRVGDRYWWCTCAWRAGVCIWFWLRKWSWDGNGTGWGSEREGRGNEEGVVESVVEGVYVR